MTSIVFFGTGPVASASLDFIRSIYNIEAVITKPRVAGYKGDTPVENLASALNLPTYFVTKRSELDELFNNTTFESSLGLVVDFGIIMSKKVIDHFELGIVNSHFSLLPRWRGADPISYTILSGDDKAGVSLMVIDEGLDTGKLITTKSIKTNTNETTGSLTEKLISLSNGLLETYLPQYLAGEVVPRNQPHPDRATFSHKISKADSIIDWSEPADVIERKIRAYQPWPQSRTTIGSIDVIITSATAIWPIQEAVPGKIEIVYDEDIKALFIGTHNGSLEIERLKPLGKKEMPIQAFLAGYRSRIGI
jgi:methionyl-tRNA formyltransferase